MREARKRTVCGVGVNDAEYDVNPTVKGKQTMCPFYLVWANMLKRAYSAEYHKRQPTYRGTTVCKEWRLFSRFKAWMVAQNWEGMELDKDIVYPGNKLYSPKTCRFVPSHINRLFNTRGRQAKKLDLPQGVYYHELSGLFRAEVNRRGKQTSLGYFKEIRDADVAYCTAKADYVLEFVGEQSDLSIATGLQQHAEIIREAHLTRET